MKNALGRALSRRCDLAWFAARLPRRPREKPWSAAAARHNAALSVRFPASGQALGELARGRLGLSRFALSGCEVIALCNALSLLGLSPDLPGLTRRCEARGGMLFGFFGVNPAALPALLEEAGAHPQTVTEAAEFDGALASARAGILSYWWLGGRGALSAGVHTVAVAPESGGVRIYNPSNRSADAARFASLADFLASGGEKRPIVLCVLR